jgi:hypothetical protein
MFFFDPMCPWAYRASLWIRAVRAEIGIDIDWRFFSLEDINRTEGKKHPWERDWSYGWSQMRIAALLRRKDPDAVDCWYAAAGASGFERGEPYFSPDGQREILAGLGWPPGLVEEALADPTTSDDVYADYSYLTDTFGGHGVPTLVFDDDADSPAQAFFGPVVLTPPMGAAAVRLWELVNGWREFPDLYEIRRPKTERDVEAINADFNSYYQARPWHTVQNPAR